ncbi:MAG: hypothetical protein VKK04_17940 [Synechococcales bacterium]|nr:hypothetical protein [Synechococcales bacterium]
MAKKLKRRKDGRFQPKSDEDRKVRSIRATDSAWESLGDLAESHNMSRADLVEQLVQDGSLSCLQGLDALSNWIEQFPDANPLQGQELPETEPIPSLEPIQELVQKLEPIQELVQKLEPIQELAQKLEPMQELVQKLEPIQELAQKLEPIQGVTTLQTISKDVQVIRGIAQDIETLHAQKGALTLAQKRAIALKLLDQFLEATGSLSGTVTEALEGDGSAAGEGGPTLSQFRHWLERQTEAPT